MKPYVLINENFNYFTLKIISQLLLVTLTRFTNKISEIYNYQYIIFYNQLQEDVTGIPN